jgi:hypothetical protein
MYEFEMLFTFRQLQNTAQQTIINKLGELPWRQEYFLSYQTIRAIKAHPLRVNFRQALHLPIAMRFRK